jgi:DNA-binding CsgD family transcriptional regulator
VVASIFGREHELEGVEEFFSPRGTGRALLLEGEPGIGKTTLWRAAVDTAARTGHRVLDARPAQREQALPYAALADLIGAVHDEARDALPPPQLRALETGLLRREGRTNARVLGTAVVTLAGELASQQPLVLAVDDLQWVDPASAAVLSFAARRLPAGTRLVLARRLQDEPPLGLERDEYQRLELGPLSLAALHHLLRAELGHAPSRPLLVRVAAAAGGNPFYVLEIARTLTADRDPNAPLTLPGSLVQLTAGRIADLSPQARHVALRVAAAPNVSPASLPGDALDEAERAGVLTVESGRVLFTHPLLATAVYDSMTSTERRTLHSCLAEEAANADDRAQHLALSATAPDAAVADELEAAARRAAARGAQESAAELARAAAQLTPPEDQGAQARRLSAAATALHAAGSPPEARQLAEAAVATAPPGDGRARALVDLATIGWVAAGELAPIECLELALRNASGDDQLRGSILAKLGMYSETDQAAAVRHLDAALDLLDERDPALLAYTLVARLFFGAQAGRGVDEALLERALELERSADPDDERSSLVLIWHQCMDQVEQARARHDLEDAWYRDRGDEIWRAEKRAHRALVEFRSGNVVEARALVEQSCAELEPVGPEGPLLLPFWTRAEFEARAGRFEAARNDLLRLLEGARRRPRSGWFVTLMLGALGSVAFDEGDAPAAVAAFDEQEELLAQLGVVVPLASRSDPEHIEALVACGDVSRAAAALARFESRHAQIPRAWTSLALPRARALVIAATDVEAALAALDDAEVRCLLPFEEARNLLLRGTLERRLKHKLAAARSLASARDIFEGLGSAPWVARAEAELERVGLRRVAQDELTATERRIAELASSGLTNREIAQVAFVSPKTVEANLARVYRKLGIRSRAQLTGALARVGAPET